MQTFLLIVQILIAVVMIGVILVQRTAQDGGGLMGGGSTMGGLFTARGSANVITRTTAILATLFIINSLALGYLTAHAHKDFGSNHIVLPQTKDLSPITAPAKVSEPTGTIEKTPKTDTTKEGSAPTTPQAPAAH